MHEHDCINYAGARRARATLCEFTEHGRNFQVAVDGRLLLGDGDYPSRAQLPPELEAQVGFLRRRSPSRM